MADLLRALRALGNDAVVAEEGPHPRDQLEPALSGRSIVVLTDRATSSGHRRYVAVSYGNSDRASRVGIRL
jgi:hypothetical protein